MLEKTNEKRKINGHFSISWYDMAWTWQYVTIYRYDNPESCRPACLDLIFPSLLLYEKLQF